MMHSYPHIASRLFNTPLMLAPAKAEIIVSAVAERFGIANLFHADGSMVMFDQAMEREAAFDRRETDLGYDMVENVAVVSVLGSLAQRTGSLRPMSGMTGYDGLTQGLVASANDDAVDAIAMEIDSPGGEVAGCFDLADTIRKIAQHKPVWAILAENAFSAAYALASAASVITVPRTGGTGSVGVIYMHTAIARALDAAGLDVTLITKGDLKADGTDVRQLSRRAIRRIKADIDEVGNLFDATVARNRGMSVRRVFDTQAGTFMGRHGVDVGFADEVASPQEALQALLDKVA